MGTSQTIRPIRDDTLPRPRWQRSLQSIMPIVKIITAAIVMTLISIVPTTTYGAEFQSLKSIQDTAQSHLAQQLKNRAGEAEITMGQLDRRLRLHRCNQALEAYLPTGGRLTGHVSIGVRCTDKQAWKLFVSANVQLFKEILVSTQYLARGTQISDSDITLSRQNVAALSRGYVSEKALVIGKVVKQPIQENHIIKPVNLTKPILVQRGKSVSIIVKNAGFSVRVQGKALSNGAKDEIIRVMNLSSKRVVEGTVLSSGVVGINL